MGRGDGGNQPLAERASGVLLHPTSLPNGHGIGDLGPSARGFIEFLAAAGQTWWQMLPVGPPGLGDSPYSATSAFALSPLLLSLDDLSDRGIVDRKTLRLPRGLGDGPASYARALRFKEERLRDALRPLLAGPDPALFETFRAAASPWLADYALFTAIQRARGGISWTRWPRALRDREPLALRAVRTQLLPEVRFHELVQWLVFEQWRDLRAYAAARGVRLLGDVPIFVAQDSADVWANRELFDLDRLGRPRVVAGVPPDYFSRSGQLWRNPVYEWDVHAQRGFAWWIARFRSDLSRFDALRLDHFIGFARCWTVAATARDAATGKFRDGPGATLFEAARRALGALPFLAEDLGAVTPEVTRLRDDLGLPGMSVLQFAFGETSGGFLPHEHAQESVVYTGTHDNPPLAAWWRAAPADVRARVRRYLGRPLGQIHWDLVRLLWGSVANVAIAPVQDLLGLGDEAIMNRPGQARGNWRWRLRAGSIDRALAAKLREITEVFGRVRPEETRRHAGLVRARASRPPLHEPAATAQPDLAEKFRQHVEESLRRGR